MTGATTTTSPDGVPDRTPDAAPLRWRLANRPDVRFGHAAGGVAGILAAAAVVAFVIEVTDDDPTLPGVGFSLLLIAIALAAGFRFRGPVRSAGVAAIAIAIPLLWLFAIVGDGADVDETDFRVILLFSIGSYLLVYFFTWTRGRAILLGLALLLAVNWIVFEVADQPAPLAVDVAGQVQDDGLPDPGAVLTDRGDKTTETAAVEIALAAALLGTAIVLDRRGRTGAATPFLFVGALTAINGAVMLGIDVEDEYATGIFVAIAGLAIGLAGSLGRRRGTSWVGSFLALVGVLLVVGKGTADAAGGDGTAGVFGGFALLGAAVLLVVGILVARALHEPIDGGEPFTPRPPKPTPPDTPEPALVAAAPAAEAGADAGAAAAPSVAWSAPAPEATTAPETPAAPDSSAAPEAPATSEAPAAPAAPAARETPAAPATPDNAEASAPPGDSPGTPDADAPDGGHGDGAPPV